MAGILYGVGVGPGDPELMTLKAVRIIKENRIIAVPGEEAEKSAAYRIALQTVPELAEKECIALSMPMVMDRRVMEENHKAGALIIAEHLKNNENVVFLTLGDPTVYSTFMYVEKFVKAMGYASEIISGIPSFCAAAARMNTSLAEWDEELHIIPAVHGADAVRAMLERDADETISEGKTPGSNYIFMKAGRKLAALKEVFRKTGKNVIMVENCGMIDEKVYRSVDEMPDKAGYFTLLIAKDRS